MKNFRTNINGLLVVKDFEMIIYDYMKLHSMDFIDIERKKVTCSSIHSSMIEQKHKDVYQNTIKRERGKLAKCQLN